MLKSLRNFFSVIILITCAKLIQLAVYDETDFYEAQKERKEKQKTEILEKAAEKVKPSNKIDSAASANETVTKEIIEEAPDEPETKSAENSPVSTISNDDYFQNLKNTYLNPILAELPEGRSREDVVVRYYKHNEDRDKVYALRALGYYLHEKEAEDSKESPSNVLYYGSDVDSRDIQIVAYTLLQNGVPLKAIEQSQYDWKYHSLEIGADSLLEGNATLKAADIQAFNR